MTKAKYLREKWEQFPRERNLSMTYRSMLWHYDPVIWYISPNSFVIKCPDPTERWWIILICWLTFSTDSHSLSTHTECLLRIWEKWSLLMRTEIWFSECLQSQDAKEHYNQISLTSPFYSFFPDQVSLNFLVWYDYLHTNIILLIITAVSTVTTALV